MSTIVVWLRRDLRLIDNPALAAAAADAEHVIPVYLWTPDEEGNWAPGGAQRWWLHASLSALGERLRGAGSGLVLGRGEALGELRRIVAETNAAGVYWNRLYEPDVMARDRRVKAGLREDGIEARSFNGACLFEPWTIETARACGTVERLIVSTDGSEIADVARRWGAETPFRRPPKLAQDDTPDEPVYRHALEWLDREEGYRPDAVVWLRPTAPLRSSEDIDGAVSVLRSSGADCECLPSPQALFS